VLQPLDLLQHTKIDYLPHATSVGGVFTAKLPVDGSSLRQLRHELANNKQDEPGDYVVRVRKDRRRNVIDVCRVAVVHTLVAHIVYDGRAFLVLRRAKNCVRRNVNPPPPLPNGVRLGGRVAGVHVARCDRLAIYNNND
jgi:hypothetical protein